MQNHKERSLMEIGGLYTSLYVFITKLIYNVLLKISHYIKIKFSYRKTDFILS